MNNIIKRIHEQMKPDKRTVDTLLENINNGDSRISEVKSLGYKWLYAAVPAAIALICICGYAVIISQNKINVGTASIETEDKVYNEEIQEFIDSGNDCSAYGYQQIELSVSDSENNVIKAQDGMVTFEISAQHYDESVDKSRPHQCEITITNKSKCNIAIDVSEIQGTSIDSLTITITSSSEYVYLESGAETTVEIAEGDISENDSYFVVEFHEVEIINITDKVVNSCDLFDYSYMWEESFYDDNEDGDCIYTVETFNSPDGDALLEIAAYEAENIYSWLESVLLISEDYAISEDEFPERSDIYGYTITTYSGEVYTVYCISSDFDPDDEYEHELNFSWGEMYCDIPYEYIEELTTIIEEYLASPSLENDYSSGDTDVSDAEQIGYEKVSDNEIASTDGVISISYVYTVEDNLFTCTVTMTNNGEYDLISYYTGPEIYATTDLTDTSMGYSYTAIGRKEILGAGETLTYDGTWELDDGWYSADVSFNIWAECEDTENNIEYGMDYDGNGIKDLDEEDEDELPDEEDVIPTEDRIGYIAFTLVNSEHSASLTIDYSADDISEREEIAYVIDSDDKDLYMSALRTITLEETNYDGTYKYTGETHSVSSDNEIIAKGAFSFDESISYTAYIYKIDDDTIGVDLGDWELSIFELSLV